MDGGARMGEALDGAGGDWTVSSDAMRWSPRAAADEHPSVDCSTGLAAELRPLVGRLVRPFAEVAGDVLDELRGLRRSGALRRTVARP